jgi:hypothetical protein
LSIEEPTNFGFAISNRHPQTHDWNNGQKEVGDDAKGYF